jgi:hypothetical protein
MSHQIPLLKKTCRRSKPQMSKKLIDGVQNQSLDQNHQGLLSTLFVVVYYMQNYFFSVCFLSFGLSFPKGHTQTKL